MYQGSGENFCRSSYGTLFACVKYDFLIEKSLPSFPPPTPPPKIRVGPATFTARCRCYDRFLKIQTSFRTNF
ncbi:hypothetical protein EHQ97_06955 [Leptospira adleri]|nr:hypothetical protein EHQ97_06955 [Leptospira adleri]